MSDIIFVQNTDNLYESFDMNLYKLDKNSLPNSVLSQLTADSGANYSGSVTVSPSDIASGTDTSTTQSANGSYQGGAKRTFDNTSSGFILGVDPKDGLAKFYIGNTTAYINWDGTTLNVVGGVNVSQINIPDSTTASSFHVDSSGNAWWGANVATGYTGANAAVLATGAATFKNILIGGATLQYQVTNAGIFSFGDGSDGDATIGAGTTTLTSDKYYNNLTISDGATLKPAGYRIFVKGTLTVGGGASGTITGDGTAGTNGSDGGNADGNAAPIGGGTGGIAVSLADGYLKGSHATGAGGNGGTGNGGTANTAGSNGGNGTNATNSLGNNASAAASGGASNGNGGKAPGTDGTAGTATTSNVKLIANWHLATLLDISSTGSTVKFDNSGSTPGGGGGAGGGANSGAAAGGGGGGGGAGGAAGRLVAIYAKTIVINAGATITANGGKGGDGGKGGNGWSNTSNGGGGGGGGGGGNGGIVIVVYNSLTNSGSITASAGAKGSKGTGGTAGSTAGNDGTDGVIGTAGTVYQFQVSL